MVKRGFAQICGLNDKSYGLADVVQCISLQGDFRDKILSYFLRTSWYFIFKSLVTCVAGHLGIVCVIRKFSVIIMVC